MNRIEILDLFKIKGFTYNPNTGDIFSHTKKLIKGKNSDGYIICNMSINNKTLSVRGHILAYYLYYGINPNLIDHINGIRDDNKIINLRDVTHKKNNLNRKNKKGYTFDKSVNKYRVYVYNGEKQIFYKLCKTEEEAILFSNEARLIYEK